jgi:cytidylate kinase
LFRIVTIEREYGAAGSVVAAKLANRLGWDLLDQSLTADIARRAEVDSSAVARCDEQVDPMLYRLAKVFWRGSHERALPLPEGSQFDTDRMVRLATEIIEAAGEKGNCVIVGRGAPYILRHRTDAMHVFVFAPREFKVDYLVRTQNMDQKKAAGLVDSIDSERASFIKHYFGKDWPNRHLYDLMINSANGIDAAVEVILHTMSLLRAEAVRAH